MFGICKSPVGVKRLFSKKYKSDFDHNLLIKLQPKAFSRVYKRFKNNGIASTPNAGQVRGVDGQKTKPEKIKLIEDYFIMNPMNSLRQASNALKIPKPTVSRILKKNTSLKPYKISIAQVLTKAHKQQRL